MTWHLFRKMVSMDTYTTYIRQAQRQTLMYAERVEKRKCGKPMVWVYIELTLMGKMCSVV